MVAGGNSRQSGQRKQSCGRRHMSCAIVRETVETLLTEPRFEDYLAGLLADGSRMNIVLGRLKDLAAGVNRCGE